MSRVLVLTTVHHPDDTRIRERLCRTLAGEFEVILAARQPGPSDLTRLAWVPLQGGRLRRILSAVIVALRYRYELLILHDPETIPLGLMARRLRRVPVVVDVHEDVPAQIQTKERIPRSLRPAAARLASWMLRVAERHLTVTLAEEEYAGLFDAPHRVFPNHPDTSAWPKPLDGSNGRAIYVGDVTRIRGLETAAAAAGRAGIPLTVIGPVGEGFRQRLQTVAGESGCDLALAGRLPHPAAMDAVRQAAVGVSPLHDVPNYRHSVPTKILEYLALGVPVVASDLPGTRGLVEGLDAVWLVPPGDAEALAEALVAASHGGQKAAAVAQAPAVRERFSWPAEEVLEFYRRLL